jgi:ATP/maltotriose-dependent transcriptional regulator MalT
MDSFEAVAQRLRALEQRVDQLEQATRTNERQAGEETGTFTDAQQAAFYDGLSQRERQVVHQIVLCWSNEQIARSLWLSKGTVANHLTTIYDKLESTGLFDNTRVDRRALIRFMGDFLDRHPGTDQADGS